MPLLSIFNLLVLMGLSQALFLSFVLGQRPHKTHGEIWLIALLVLLAIEMAFQIYYDAKLYTMVPVFIGLDAATFFLYGPLLWLFMRGVAQQPLPAKRWLLLHFLPAALLQWNAFAYFFLNPEHINFVEEMELLKNAPSVWDPLSFVQEAVIGGYLLACWRVWLQYRTGVEAERAAWYLSGLVWMKQVLQVFTLLWLLLVVRDQLLIWWGRDGVADRLLTTLLPLTIFYLAYCIWQRVPPPLVLKSVDEMSTAPVVEAVNVEVHQADCRVAPKYQKSALDEESAARIFEDLQRLMKDVSPWREPELDLAGLAERLGVSVHYLSQTINTHAGVNFYDYVNSFRVEAVQEALSRSHAASVLDIAFDCGFNSKSAFYTSFKRQTGLTPKAYQEAKRAA